MNIPSTIYEEPDAEETGDLEVASGVLAAKVIGEPITTIKETVREDSP